MPKMTALGVTLVLAGIARLFAQQPPPSVITDQIMDMDAANYLGIGNTTPNVDVVIAQRSHFDPVNNTYILADHPNEQHRARTATRDELQDFRELTYNCDAVIILLRFAAPRLQPLAVSSSPTTRSASTQFCRIEKGCSEACVGLSSQEREARRW